MEQKYVNYKSKYVNYKSKYLDNSINEIIKFFLQFRTFIKIYHFQTNMYAYHKISDELLISIDSLSDKLIEALLGKLNIRPDFSNLDNKTLVFENIDNNKFINILDNSIIFLNKNFTNITYSEILNIRDEILGEIDKAKYLLSFK